jgi:hypothetical protein
MDPDGQSLLDSLERARETDPRAGIRLGADSLVRRMIEALRDERGVNADLLLLTLGSLAGYSCQHAVRAVAAADEMPRQLVFGTVQGADGRYYFSGDRLNYYLVQGPRSVWRGISMMALSLGAAQHELPDVNEIATHVASTVGTPGFGAVRYPPGHGGPLPGPEQVLRHFWPQWLSDLEVFTPNPKQQPELMTVGIRATMDMIKDAVPPAAAVAIAMEAAVAMSQVDLSD